MTSWRMLFRAFRPQTMRKSKVTSSDRSEAKRRDLRFYGPFLEMFFQERLAQRNDLRFPGAGGHLFSQEPACILLER